MSDMLNVIARQSNKYTVPAICTNCGEKGRLWIDKGVRRPDRATCPNCGCETYVRPLDK